MISKFKNPFVRNNRGYPKFQENIDSINLDNKKSFETECRKTQSYSHRLQSHREVSSSLKQEVWVELEQARFLSRLDSSPK